MRRPEVEVSADPRSLPLTLPATARCLLALRASCRAAHLMSGRQEAVSVWGIRPVTASRTVSKKDGLMVFEHGYWNVNGTAYSPVMLAMVGRSLTTLDVARC